MMRNPSRDAKTLRDTDLIRRLAPGLVLYARQWSRSAEDVVQDAFLKLFRQPAAARKRVRMALPGRPPRRDEFCPFRFASRSARAVGQRFSRDVVRTRHRGNRLISKSFTDALRSQPLELRETIVARIWGGLSFDEIALLTGASPSTASRRYKAGLEALREQLRVLPEEKDK